MYNCHKKNYYNINWLNVQPGYFLDYTICDVAALVWLWQKFVIVSEQAIKVYSYPEIQISYNYT